MDYLVFSGNSNRTLAQGIVSKLGIRLGDATVSKFSDGEIFVRINESVRGGMFLSFNPQTSLLKPSDGAYDNG